MGQKNDRDVVVGKANVAFVWSDTSDNTLTVDPKEFDMIAEFLLFVRNRERGTFTSELVTHKNRRFVMIDKTDRVKIDLNEVVEDE
jgi:hypothetical protein